MPERNKYVINFPKEPLLFISLSKFPAFFPNTYEYNNKKKNPKFYFDNTVDYFF